MRFSLFSKILFWVLLNLLCLGGILLFIFNLDFRFSPRSPFFRESANRIEAVSRLISDEISDKTRDERDQILAKYAEVYKVEFFVFDQNNNQIAGRSENIPAAVVNRLKEFQVEMPPFESRPPPPQRRFDDDRRPPRPLPPRGGRPPFFLTTSDPTLYWTGSPIVIFENNQTPARAVLLTASPSASGYGLFFDPKPWLIIVGAVTAFSILFWLPFIRSLTKSIGQMTAAAEQIAEENFDARVSDRRSDELGRLGKAINQLAARLSGFVGGQKRFLGDVSHELNSPLARLQLALNIIEEDADEKTRRYVEKAQDEVRLMSKLVGEVISFSKAGIKARNVRLENVNLLSLVENIITRENVKGEAEFEIRINENLTVQTSAEMLDRALSNVARNAIRYAADAGKITIEAWGKNSEIRLTVTDQGTGVAEAELEKIFDPFYRVAAHRSRESGGTGLGLAIVKTCVEACGGKVFARNIEPHGLKVTIILKKSQAETRP